MVVDIQEKLDSVTPLEIQINKGGKVSETLLVKRWDFSSLRSAIETSSVAMTEEQRELVVETAIALSEFDFHLVERAVERVGMDMAKSILRETQVLLDRSSKSLDVLATNRDALFTADGRRRTPGGVFWRFLKQAVSKDDAKYIFKDNTKRQQTIRRQIVRETWTENHLTILKKRDSTDVDSVDRKKQKHLESIDSAGDKVARQIMAVKEITSSLSMSEVSIVERLIVRKSIDYAMVVLAEVKSLCAESAKENGVSMLTLDNGRRRTPGGVFAQIVKHRQDLSEGDKKFIFAKATGGRAPSMSDLLTMSMALRDRIAVGPTVGHANKENLAPINNTHTISDNASSGDTWEYQRKVGKTWLPGFVGQDSFDKEMPMVDVSTDSEEEVLAKITKGLKLFNDIWFLHRAKKELGMAGLVETYHQAIALEKKGGLAISEKINRKRTPKGIFIACVRKQFAPEVVARMVGSVGLPPVVIEVPLVRAPEIASLENSSISRLADKIIVELERLRIPESDFEIMRNVVAIKGELFVRTLFEKVRKRFNRGKWQDTPGQLFGRMLKSCCSNDELNEIFDASRSTQQLRHLTNVSVAAGRSLVRRASSSVYRSSTPATGDLSDEQCARDTTIGLSLIGVTASEVSTIERVIAKLGADRALELLKQTRDIEYEGGQRTRDGLRRKTPSGVYLSLLMDGGEVSKEDQKYIFEKSKKSSEEERKKEDMHFAPSLFTPLNPFRVIDSSGKSTEFIEQIKNQIRPALDSLEFISVLDPRLETVIRGVVLLGTGALNLLDKCIYYFGEKRAESWLEIAHAQVASSETPENVLTNLPHIYNDLVKAAGGLPETALIRPSVAPSMGC